MDNTANIYQKQYQDGVIEESDQFLQPQQAEYLSLHL